MTQTRRFISSRAAAALLPLAFVAAPVLAQSTAPVPSNVVSFQSSSFVEVQQDTIRLNLSTSIDGNDAADVQARLKVAVDKALQVVKPSAEEGKMDVSTGNFRLNPRYNSKDGKINGWNGYAEVVLEGTDFARITAAAGKVQTLTMNGVSFGLSRKARAGAEEQAQAQAIAQFQQRAQQLTKAFGFGGYTLREVSVNGNEYGGAQPEARAYGMKVASMADAPVPVEPGKSKVEVSVNGSVQMK